VENLPALVEKACGPDAPDPETAIGSLRLESPKKVEKDIAALLKATELPAIAADKLKRHVMGVVMHKFRGAIPGRRISELVDAFIA